MTRSFMRGLVEDAIVQYATRMGKKVARKKKRAVLKPPPSFHDRYVGTPTSSEIKMVLEKLTLPGPSAGSGGLWMAGDCVGEGGMSQGRFCCSGTTYCCELDAAVMLDFERRRRRGRRRLEREVRSYVVRHDDVAWRTDDI